MNLVGNYVANQIGPAELPPYCYYPVYDSNKVTGSASRVILALGSLQQAGRILGTEDFVRKAHLGLEACLRHVEQVGERHTLCIPGLTGGAGADCLLLIALATSDTDLLHTESGRQLIDGLSTLLHCDGAISSLPPGRRTGSDDEVLPGVALLAAAKVAESGLGPFADPADLGDRAERILTWYCRRFRVRPSWEMMPWQAQAWTAVHALTKDAKHAAFVFEMTDWAVDRQLRKDGSFVTDLWHDGPSFHTAFVAEGVAAAWALAEQIADQRRAKKYAASWRAAMDFMNRLIVRQADTFCMPRPAAAIGGVRLSSASCQLRIDYAGHLLAALSAGVLLLRQRTVRNAAISGQAVTSSGEAEVSGAPGSLG